MPDSITPWEVDHAVASGQLKPTVIVAPAGDFVFVLGSEVANHFVQLEPGDHLLPWGDRGRAARYCHFTPEDEMRQLLSSLSFDLVSSYSADGREENLNQYFICRFRSAQEVPKKG